MTDINKNMIPKIGMKVRLYGCPFDLQIEEEQWRFEEIFSKTQIITDIKTRDTAGYWIKTDLMPEWTVSLWFRETNDENL